MFSFKNVLFLLPIAYCLLPVACCLLPYHSYVRRNQLPHLINPVIRQLNRIVPVILRMEDAQNHRGNGHIVFVFKDVFVETLLEFVMVIAGVVEMGQDGDATADTVFLRISVNNKVLAALPIDHHEGTVRFTK